MSSHLIWYVARASGIVTWALLATSVIWGLTLTTRVLGRNPRPAWILDLHRFLAGSALVFLAIHMTSIAMDTYVHFGPVSLLVPLTGSWHPVAVAWGIVATYLLVALEASSLLRSRLPLKLWRKVHYLSLPLFAVATVHGLSAGTDRHTLALRVGMLGVSALVVVLTAVRIAKAGGAGNRGTVARTPDRRRPAPTWTQTRPAELVGGTR